MDVPDSYREFPHPVEAVKGEDLGSRKKSRSRRSKSRNGSGSRSEAGARSGAGGAGAKAKAGLLMNLIESLRKDVPRLRHSGDVQLMESHGVRPGHGRSCSIHPSIIYF